ncbi:MAG: hypothetical protein GF347_04460 [Candidatus Moranbacteria bacterium]|nr:hypothetical protein [Candidatus Moranbacteria bacterium]
MVKLVNPQSELQYVNGLLYGDEYYEDSDKKAMSKKKKKQRKSLKKETLKKEEIQAKEDSFEDQDVIVIKEKEKREVSGPYDHVDLDNNFYEEERSDFAKKRIMFSIGVAAVVGLSVIIVFLLKFMSVS